MTTTQSGLLLIADISGYTMFLSASELDHAQEILSTLPVSYTHLFPRCGDAR